MDAEEQEDVKNCAEFLSLSKTRTEQQEKKMEKTKNIIPLDQMTIEDLMKSSQKANYPKRSIPTGLTSQLRIYKLESRRKCFWLSYYKLWTL